MSHIQSPADEGEGEGGRKAYSVNIQVKAQSSTSCSFCWFMMTIYPALKGMTEKDSSTFRLHLEKVHGLAGEIGA